MRSDWSTAEIPHNEMLLVFEPASYSTTLSQNAIVWSQKNRTGTLLCLRAQRYY